jgi:peptide/nickel transport system permease protein
MSIRRKVWERRIKNFWQDFSHNKIGLLGVIIIVAFVFVAIFQSVIAPVGPEQRWVAEQYAYPEWYANLIPSLRNLPRTTYSVLTWEVQNETDVLKSVGVTFQRIGDTTWIRYNGTTPVQILLTAKWDYPWDPPQSIDINLTYGADPGKPATTWYALELNLTTPSGANKTNTRWDDTFPIWDAYWWRYQLYNRPILYGQIKSTPGYSAYPFLKSMTNFTLDMSPNHLFYRLGYEPYTYAKTLMPDVFGPPGEFTFKMYVTIKPIEGVTNTTCTISLKDGSIGILGLVYGLLGTNWFGSDCWSRLIYGVRVSLAVGLVAALLSTSFGILVGVVAGFMGGAIDEVLMRVVDVLICLPALPILIVLVALFGRSIWYIVLIIAVFGWQGLARMIRAQTLSIREMSFIECAQASGGSKSYIMAKHIVPNIMPIALADMVLSIPGAIVLEAALSFIGFGDPTTPTWGREFNLAYNVGSGFQDFIWWWVIPPGIAITLLCLAFVFVSHAIDEIVNPRLRRRR